MANNCFSSHPAAGQPAQGTTGSAFPSTDFSQGFGMPGFGSGSGSGSGSPFSFIPGLGAGFSMPGLGNFDMGSFCGNPGATGAVTTNPAHTSHGGAGQPTITTGSTTNQSIGSGNPNSAFGQMQNALGDVCGMNKSYTTIHPDYYDPLEGSGQGARTTLYTELGGLNPTMQRNAALTSNSLIGSAAAPGFAQGAQLASDTMAGKYLNGSPALDDAMGAMRAGAAADAENNAARIRSQYAQNGMSFGTGNQQAQDAAQAASTAQANQTEANARLQNYEAERSNQNNAINQYATALTTPLNYLAQANEPYLQPMTEIAQIVRGLSGGGTVAQPDTVANNGPTQDLMSMIGGCL